MKMLQHARVRNLKFACVSTQSDVFVGYVKSHKELRRIKVGGGPWGIAIVPKQGRLRVDFLCRGGAILTAFELQAGPAGTPLLA